MTAFDNFDMLSPLESSILTPTKLTPPRIKKQRKPIVALVYESPPPTAADSVASLANLSSQRRVGVDLKIPASQQVDIGGKERTKNGDEVAL